LLTNRRGDIGMGVLQEVSANTHQQLICCFFQYLLRNPEILDYTDLVNVTEIVKSCRFAGD